ncbi:MAG: rRNA (guanosine2251-2-O)-methyltransferase [Patescibacteria group bacterium]|nr:rRNA (guanosine2251-2-O)-methyltransferase [Patescibacteria group bacterium]
MSEIIVIAHNIRSTYNIGAIFRTCEGFGVSKIIISGYSPYPKTPTDTRLPHISEKLTAQIHKTALDSENMVPFEHQEVLNLENIKSQGYKIIGLEQDENSIMLQNYKRPEKIALLLGEEVHGITEEMRSACDDLIEIPMFGKKESFNVSVATGIALYGLVI